MITMRWRLPGSYHQRNADPLIMQWRAIHIRCEMSTRFEGSQHFCSNKCSIFYYFITCENTLVLIFLQLFHFGKTLTTVVTLSYDVHLLWNAPRMTPSVQLISNMHCNASLRWVSQCLLFITITIINEHIISRIHICLYCTDMLLKMIVFNGKVLTWPLGISKALVRSLLR